MECGAVLRARNNYGASRRLFSVSFPVVNWPQQCAVVIPCRNEARAIASLVREVRAHLPHVIVVNDGSVDDTAAQAAGAGAEVMGGAAIPGKGAALRAGWQRAQERGFAWVLCLDGDGQHAAVDIPQFLACAESTAASLIVGNRMNQAEQMPWLRRFVNRWMSRRLSRLAGHDLPDSQCGFRLLRLAALDRVPLRADQFEIESEQLLAFLAAGERVEFVPVQVIYRLEQSKIHPWRDTLRWFRWRRRWLKSSAPPQSVAIQNKTRPSPR
jgi:glycosyltransferase involved in cell wall biosynthesis